MRYRAGWYIPGQILALTHFDSVATPEDFAGIAATTYQALQEVTRPFHLLIDNRIIADVNVASLETMLRALPILNHPQLRWIVVVLPKTIREQASDMPTQQHEHIQLRYVDSLETALQHLRTVDESIDWPNHNPDFFTVQP